VKSVQPWAWTGYAQQGVIEFWRETNDQRVADFLVRVADWYIGKGLTNPPLRGGRTLSDGTYLPIGTSYNWIPNAVSVQPGFRATISFRSAQFTASSTKTYGQTALTINDYLPELLNVVVKPRTTVVIPSSQPSPSPTPTPTGGGGGGTGTGGGGGGLTLPPEIPAPSTAGMINAAYRKLASASSVKSFPNMTG